VRFGILGPLELSDLAMRHPLRERLVELKMRALQAVGRRSIRDAVHREL
jgi:hypothetical protein